MTSIPTEQTAADPAPRTAEIIPFPLRQSAQPAALSVEVVAPQTRLARALDMLNAALVEQRVAVTAWRSALADLKTSTASLGDNLGRYRGSLQHLGQDVDALRAQVKVLGTCGDPTAPTPG